MSPSYTPSSSALMVDVWKTSALRESSAAVALWWAIIRRTHVANSSRVLRPIVMACPSRAVSLEAVVVQVSGQVSVSAVVDGNVDHRRSVFGEGLRQRGGEFVEGVDAI